MSSSHFNQSHPHCIEISHCDKPSVEASTSLLPLTLKNACLVNSINGLGALPSNLIQECYRHEWVIKALFQDKRQFPARKKLKHLYGIPVQKTIEKDCHKRKHVSGELY